MDKELLQEFSNIVKAEVSQIFRIEFQKQNENIDRKLAEQKEYVDQRFAEQKEYIDKRFAEQKEYIDKKIETEIEIRFAEQKEYIYKRFAEQKEYIDKRFTEQKEYIDKRFAEQKKEIDEIISNRMFIFEEQYGRILTLIAEMLDSRNKKEEVQDKKIQILERSNETNSAYTLFHEKRINSLENGLRKIVKN